MAYRFSLGIDLGTSNSAIAFSEVESDQTEILEITQVLGPNGIGEKPTLPSVLYIRTPKNFLKARFPCHGGPPSAAMR
jgi:molecular chaperone DnaK (HSP70)